MFAGRSDRFDWKIVGKQEMLIPYNSNRLHTPTKDSDVLLANHLNPDHVRWELHRVYVVEATLKAGQRLGIDARGVVQVSRRAQQARRHQLADDLLAQAVDCDWSPVMGALDGHESLYVLGRGPALAIASEAAMEAEPRVSKNRRRSVSMGIGRPRRGISGNVAGYG